MNDMFFMELVLQKAEQSLNSGESPFSAGIVVGGKLVVVESNRTKSGRNPLRHAETEAISAFFKAHPQELLRDSVLYSSCEPCLMCFGAIYNAGIPRLVYGASINDAIRYSSGDVPVDIKLLGRQLQMEMDITGGVLRERAVQLFSDYINIHREL